MNKTRSYKPNDNYEEKLNSILSERGITFSDYVRQSIDRDFSGSVSELDKDTNISKKRIYVRLYEEDEKQLSEVANRKGVTLAQEIRFRVSSTLGSNVFDWNEATSLKDAMNEIAKVGRLMNQAIKNNLLVGTKQTSDLNAGIAELRKTFLKLYDNAIKRVR